jgi:formylglycine-generating enzyme required for sulfatase activity
MGVRRAAVFGLLAVLCGASSTAACQIVDGLGSVVFTDGGTNDVAVDLSCSFDGPAPVTPMVRAGVLAKGAFCIDSTEVTFQQYSQFSADAALPEAGLGVCTQVFTPSQLTSTAPCRTPPDEPVSMVPFCGAAWYCAAHGGTICSSQEWTNACRGPHETSYPYGSQFEAGTCNVDGSAPGPVPWNDGSCPGGYPGLYDMIGNVAEWTATCTEDKNLISCPVLGGGYQAGSQACPPAVASPASLDASLESFTDRSPSIGFRCCAPLLSDGGCPQ